MVTRTSITQLLICGLALAFSVFPIRLVHAELLVHGADPVEERTLETWYEHHMPAPFRVRTRLTVNQFSDRQMDAYLKSGNESTRSEFNPGDDGTSDTSDIDGVFDNDPSRIALRIPASGQTDYFTFAHEYGHYVWFVLMNARDHQKYESIYRRQRAAHHLVTRYAESDLEEGFAEAFSFYVNQPPLLARRDSASYEFFGQWAEANR